MNTTKPGKYGDLTTIATLADGDHIGHTVADQHERHLARHVDGD